jgi:hypothetical protein
MRRSLIAASTLAAALIALPSAAQFTSIPNSIKYRDAGLKNATGRSGSASIETRALLAKDGNATLDVTSGSFDSVSSGSLDKVQVKLDGDTAARNFTSVDSATFSTPLGQLSRGVPLSVSALVSGVDDQRTDVVSVSDFVKLRPDLRVTKISVAPHGITTLPVLVSAIVSETNGDVGARADCVLYADGAEAGRARGIWVDAKSSVTCSMSTLLGTTGVHHLRVAVESVNPGDYDDSNNSGSADVHIYDHASEFPQWNAGAVEYTATTITDSTSNTSASHTEDSQSYRDVSFNAYIYGPFDVRKLGVSAAVSSDGYVFADEPSVATQWFSLPPWWGGTGGARIAGKNFHGLVLSSGAGANQVSEVNVGAGGGVVTYHAEGWGTDANGNYYTWNSDTSWSTGGPFVEHSFGDTVSMSASVSDGSTMWQADAFMTLQPYDRSATIIPWSCYTNWWTGQTYCSGQRVEDKGRAGSDSSASH